MNENWLRYASCRDENSDAFFPVGDEDSPAAQEQYDIARMVCQRCPVQAKCLQLAYDYNIFEHGMFGGLTPKERKRIRKKETSKVNIR